MDTFDAPDATDPSNDIDATDEDTTDGLDGLSEELKAAAAAAGCTRVRENRSISLHGHMYEDRYTEWYDGGGKPHQSAHTTADWGLGGLKLTAALCHTKNGWRILNPPRLDTGYIRLKVDNGKIVYDGTAGRGWGIMPKQVNATSMDVQTFVCDKDPFWWILDQVNSIPGPGGMWVVVGQYIAGQLLKQVADSTDCQALSDLTLNFSFTSDGKFGKVRAEGTRISTESAPLDQKLITERKSVVKAP